jgi:hypothetical protein
MSRFASRFRLGQPLLKWMNARQIKRVQRGTVTINNATSATATIEAVDLQNSVIRFLGQRNVSTGTTGEAQCLRVALTNATTVTGFVTASEAVDHVISFEVIEYMPGVIRLAHRGTVSLVSASSGTATIPMVALERAELTYLGHTNDSTSLRGVEFAQLTLTANNTVTGRTGGAQNATIGFQVIEWY